MKGPSPHEERELQIAREIQSGLLPAHPLVAGPWEVHGTILPFPKLGGAFLDFYSMGEHRFAVALGESSGWGIGAVLKMSGIYCELRAFCDLGLDLAEEMSRLNRILAGSGDRAIFVTLFFAVIDYSLGVLDYVNAGHAFPLLRRADGHVERLEDDQPVLGMLEEIRFRETRVPFRPGDRLLVYSGGMIHAEDAEGTQFGSERLTRLWQKCDARSVDEMLRDLLQAVSGFRGATPQTSDMAALVVAARGD